MEGVTFTYITDRTYPRRIYLLTFDPEASPGALDVTLARQQLPGYATVSAMAMREGAIAAVNGDFGLYPGRPAHGFADDGVLLQTPVVGKMGNGFGLSADEVDPYVGGPSLSIRLHRYAHDVTWRIPRWNEGPPGPKEVVGFSPMGGTVEAPPEQSCSARLLPAGDAAFALDGATVTQDFAVDEVLCARPPMPLEGGIVVSARRFGSGAGRVSRLDVGETVSLSWTYGWRNLLDSIGGGPVLLKDRVLQVRHCAVWFCGRAPRTAVGVTADGRILIMVVDGRNDRWSVGMTLKETAVFLRDMGAVDAINLDGGGSSEMWLQGEVMNRPSDGRERRVSSALLILPTPGPVIPASFTAMPRTPAVRTSEQVPEDRAASKAALDDAASTGGLLDYLP